MIFHCNEKTLIVIFSIVLILSGCSGKSGKTLATEPGSTTSHSKEVKPGAPVKLVSTSNISITPNQPTQINVELETSEMNGYLELDLLPSQGLDIGDTPNHQTLNVTNIIKIPMTLLVRTDGRYYLNIHIRINNGESSSTRILALIVHAGEKAETKTQFKKPTEENVVSLPAEEKISSQ